MRRIFFTGPLPPPIHGFAIINGHMLSGLERCGTQVETFDLAPRSFFSPLLRWFAFLAAVLKRSEREGRTLYLPISGGMRQLIDLMFAIPAKWLGFRLFVHHHTFAYLNKKPWISRLTFFILKEATHIVLCPAMGRKLCMQYGIGPSKVRVLSNAAFLDIGVGAAANVSAPLSSLTMGFLSNITAEKGIFSFFDALDLLSAQRVPFKALIAGPVSPEVKAEFDARLAATAGVQHLGAVYGEAKDQFFGQLDLLLFPSYANEAEPVTLWEAMAHSVPIVALQRGCIQGIVPTDAGRVVLDPGGFSSAVVEEVLAMTELPALLESRRVASRAGFEAARLRSRLALQSLLHEMTGIAAEVPLK